MLRDACGAEYPSEVVDILTAGKICVTLGRVDKSRDLNKEDVTSKADRERGMREMKE